MPVTQLPIDKKNNRYSIAFAFRPGDNSVRYSYDLPYPNNAAALKVPTVYPGRVVFVAPPGLQVTGDGLAAAGQEQGMNLYLRQDVPAGTLVAVNVSGAATSNASAGAEGAPPGRDAQDAAADSGGATIQAVPGRLGDWKMLLSLSGVLAAFFAGFAYLLSRKTVVAVAGGEVGADAEAAKPDRKVKAQRAATTGPAATAAQSGSNGVASLSEVDAAIGTSLDALKESLFRLELRHQAGTITEEEYARERAKAEKVLRDLVRG